MVERPDLELVRRAANGDCDSFTQLCQRYYPAMVAIAHSVLGDRHLAEDAAQQGFAKAVRKLGQLKKKNHFAAWLTVICRNEAINLARAAEKLRCTEDLSTIAAKPQADDHTEAVREAIGRLPAPAKELIYLRYYDGMTYEQMSAVLGISGQAINGRLRRAKKKIAEHLRRNDFTRVQL